MKRRTLIQISAAAGLAGCRGPDQAVRARLTEAELALLELVCEQIVPTDEDPGAREAGAAHYIDRQFSKRLKAFPERYRQGLAALDATSHDVYGRGFAALTFAERTALLRKVESSKVKQELWPHQPSRQFFAIVREHTIEGVFSHPRHGGNRDLVGYRMLGWEYPEPRGQNRYTDARFTARGKEE